MNDEVNDLENDVVTTARLVAIQAANFKLNFSNLGKLSVLQKTYSDQKNIQ